MGAPSALPLARAAWGVALVVAPRTLLPPPRDRAAVAVAGVLGLRQLGEAALLRAEPDARWRWLGVAVDGVHAATAVAAAVHWPRRRAQASLNAATALALAGLGAWAARAAR